MFSRKIVISFWIGSFHFVQLRVELKIQVKSEVPFAKQYKIETRILRNRSTRSTFFEENTSDGLLLRLLISIVRFLWNIVFSVVLTTSQDFTAAKPARFLQYFREKIRVFSVKLF